MSNEIIDRICILSGVHGQALIDLRAELEQLSNDELHAKLQQYLNGNQNWGIGDSYEFGNVGETPNALKPQPKPVTVGAIFSQTPIEQRIPILNERQAQEIALLNLSAINREFLGDIIGDSDADQDAASLIAAEQNGIEMLYKSISPEGLTWNEYLDSLRDDVKEIIFIFYPEMRKHGDQLSQRLDSLDLDQLKTFQNRLLSEPDKDDIIRDLAMATQTFTNGLEKPREIASTGSSKTPIINQPYSPSNGETLIDFKTLYKIERGVDFDENKVRQYLIDGTVTFYEDPLDGGINSETLERLEKHSQYTQRFPASYLSAFGQPYRAEYISVLNNSDYSAEGHGVSRVRLNSELRYDEEGTEFVIPSRDMTQPTIERELNNKELKRFAAEMLYNMINSAYLMLQGYHEGLWDELKHGSVGGALTQGFANLIQYDPITKLANAAGADINLAISAQIDKLEGMLAKAIQLKNMSDEDIEKHFEEIFKELTNGNNFDTESMQKLAQLTMNGAKTDSDMYNKAIKNAFGMNLTDDAQTEFSILSPINGVLEIVTFLAGSEVIGGSKLFAKMGAKSLQVLGETGGRMAMGFATMETYSLATKGTAFALSEGYNLYQGNTEGFLGRAGDLAVGLVEDGAMGAAAVPIGNFANRSTKLITGIFKKETSSVIGKTFSTLSKTETSSAQTLMKNYYAAMSGQSLTNMGNGVISAVTNTIRNLPENSLNLLLEALGFAGYSTVEQITEALLSGDIDLNNINLSEELLGQIEGLATLKGIARFIQMRKSGNMANPVIDKMTEKLKDYTVKKTENGKYEITSPEGRKTVFDTPEEVLSHLFNQMFARVESTDREYDSDDGGISLGFTVTEPRRTSKRNTERTDVLSKLDQLKDTNPELYDLISKYKDNPDFDNEKFENLISRMEYTDLEESKIVLKILDYALENKLEIDGNLFNLMANLTGFNDIKVTQVKTDFALELLSNKNLKYKDIKDLIDSMSEKNSGGLINTQRKVILNLLNNHKLDINSINNLIYTLFNSSHMAGTRALGIDKSLGYLEQNGYKFLGGMENDIRRDINAEANPLRDTYILKALKDGKVYKLTFKNDGTFVKSEIGKESADIKQNELETADGSVVTFTSKRVENILNRFVKEVRDSEGNLIYKEYYTQSKDLPGKYEICKQDATGKKYRIGLAEITPDGEIVIEKTLESGSGTKTNYFYAESPNGDRMTYTTIVDKTGKELYKNSQQHKKLGENHYVSIENGKKYDIKYENNSIIITTENGESVSLPVVKNGENGISENLINTILKLPGSVLIDINKYGLNRIAIGKSTNAHYDLKNNEIIISEEYAQHSDLEFTLLHELGHYKDCATGIQKDPEIKRVYQEEREIFLLNNSYSEYKEMEYFIENADPRNILKNPMEEMIAEINAILYCNNMSPKIESRSAFMQEHFPRTYALVAAKLTAR